MQITRREFIYAACGTALVATSGALTKSFGQAAKGAKPFPIPPEAYADPLYSMTAKQLSGFVGRTFRVTGENIRPTSIVLKQVNVLELPQNTLDGCYGDCFSLIFDGDVKRPLTQDRYVLETDGLEQCAALLVPVSMQQARYELIVNHISR